jgi:hypothetical protein
MSNLRPIATLSLAALSLLAASTTARAFNPQPDPPARLGVITLDPGQTIRLNTRVVKGAASASTEVPPGPCRVQMNFVDGEGRGVSQVLIALLRPGQGARLDLPGEGVSSAGNALMLHPVVRVLPAVQRTLPAVQSCAVAVTVEVLEPGGHVAAIVADPLLVTADSAEQ